ncbi:MAG: nuclear transport factor 2 family protein [Acidobacteriales bacterium]|nr:nuclear transport factor 2 family protein [Terriglobales bacterium]
MRHFVWAAIIVLGFALPGPAESPDAQADVRRVIQQFEEGVAQRDLKKIEAVVADDLVVFENGHRNDGWTDFRDNHLKPELAEPAPQGKSEIIRIKAGGNMGWGYSRAELAFAGKDGKPSRVELWSAYVLEKRADGWKIVLLDWSIRRLKP